MNNTQRILSEIVQSFGYQLVNDSNLESYDDNISLLNDSIDKAISNLRVSTMADVDHNEALNYVGYAMAELSKAKLAFLRMRGLWS